MYHRTLEKTFVVFTQCLGHTVAVRPRKKHDTSVWYVSWWSASISHWVDFGWLHPFSFTHPNKPCVITAQRGTSDGTSLLTSHLALCHTLHTVVFSSHCNQAYTCLFRWACLRHSCANGLMLLFRISRINRSTSSPVSFTTRLSVWHDAWTLQSYTSLKDSAFPAAWEYMLFRDAHLQSGCDTASASGCITVIWPVGFLTAASFALLIDTNGNQDVPLVLDHSPNTSFICDLCGVWTSTTSARQHKFAASPCFPQNSPNDRLRGLQKLKMHFFQFRYLSVSFWSQRIRDEENGTTLMTDMSSLCTIILSPLSTAGV